MEFVDLRAEAIAEARRLAGSRAMTVDGDERVLTRLQAEGPWIAIARRPRTRRVLGRRLLLVWRVAFEDEVGASVEARLVAVVVDLKGNAPRHRRRRPIEALVRELEPEIRDAIETDGAEWRIAAQAVLGALTSRRTARERAIAASAGTSTGDAFQPGLFDRRAERARRQATTAAGDTESVTARRLGAIARSTPIGPPAAQLMLVLAP